MAPQRAERTTGYELDHVGVYERREDAFLVAEGYRTFAINSSRDSGAGSEGVSWGSVVEEGSDFLKRRNAYPVNVRSEISGRDFDSQPETRTQRLHSQPETRTRPLDSPSETRTQRLHSQPETRTRPLVSPSETRTRRLHSQPETRTRPLVSPSETRTSGQRATFRIRRLPRGGTVIGIGIEVGRNVYEQWQDHRRWKDGEISAEYYRFRTGLRLARTALTIAAIYYPPATIPAGALSVAEQVSEPIYQAARARREQQFRQLELIARYDNSRETLLREMTKLQGQTEAGD